MKRFFLMAAMATSLAFSGAATTPVRAGGSDVAAGLIGGLAAGTIIGAAATAPTLLWTTAGIRGTCAILLLDARRAGVGWVPGRLDVPCCQSLRITRASITRASLERTTSCGSTTTAFQCPLLTQADIGDPNFAAAQSTTGIYRCGRVVLSLGATHEAARVHFTRR